MNDKSGIIRLSTRPFLPRPERRPHRRVSGHRSFVVFQRYNIRNLRDVAAGLRRTEVYLQQADTSRTMPSAVVAKPAP